MNLHKKYKTDGDTLNLLLMFHDDRLTFIGLFYGQNADKGPIKTSKEKRP